jgi:hypothetical protein
MRLATGLCTAVTAVLVVACGGDSVTSPGAATHRGAPTSNHPAFDMSGGKTLGDQLANFTLTPAGGSFPLMGLFAINFPANSVCDPNQSNYADWGQDCAPLSDNIDVQVHLRVTASSIALDFSPQIRFAPSAGAVTISTDVFAPILTSNRPFFSAHPASLDVLAMSYAPALGATPIADYQSDPALITHVNLVTGRVWRVVRHFSGYLVGGGDTACDPLQDVGCVALDTTR